MRININTESKQESPPSRGSELIKIIPAIGWIIFAFIFILMFHRKIDVLLRNVSSFSAFGVEAKFFEQKFEQYNSKKNLPDGAKLTERQQLTIIQRGERLLPILHD